MRFDGRVALIAGAASPFARTTAVALAEAGADIALAVDSLEEADLFAMNSIANELWALGRRHAAIALEPGHLADSVTQAVAELGRIDILISLPAAPPTGADQIIETAESSVLEHLQRRLGGILLLCRAAGAAMRASGGTALIAVDAVGMSGTTGAVSAAAEAGIEAATRALAQEWKSRIAVNAVVVRPESAVEQLASLAAQLADTPITGQVFQL